MDSEERDDRYIYESSLPRYLYHYTGPAGLLGICRSKTLWAARAADLNDGTEQKLAWQLLRSIAALAPTPEYRDEIRAVMRLADWALNGPAERPLLAIEPIVPHYVQSLYTFSLTDVDDSLEQWRAYSPRSGGVAIGFDAARLREVAEAQGFQLARCRYDETAQVEVVDGALLKHHNILKGRLEDAGTTRDEDLDDFRSGLADDIIRLAPLLKHESFRAESEWRLVSGVDCGAAIERVPSDAGIKEFANFKLVLDDGLSAVDEEHPLRFRVGPNVNPVAMAQAAGAALEDAFEYVQGFRTSTPYTPYG